MTMYNEKGLLMDKWHKTPNAIIDSLVGTHISPNAGWVIITVIRHTDGFGRDVSPIPTATFMRVLGTNRNKTAYQYIDEAVNSGLINVIKQNGKVSEYSINKKCSLWYGVDELKPSKPVAENATTQPVAESATSGGNRLQPVAESATATSGENRHTYKDNNINTDLKKKVVSEEKSKNPDLDKKPKTKKSESTSTEFNPIEYRIPEYVNSDLWKSYHEMRKKQGSKKIATEKACEIILNDFENWHKAGLDVNEALENSIKSNWIGVFEPKRRINQPNNQPQNFNYQGQAHANYQPTHSQDYDTSTTYGYASKLTADANAYYAQRRAERANDGIGAIDVYSMESPL